MRENQTLFETTDWAATPLGSVCGWPKGMHAVIDAVLASGFPVCTVWGEQSIQIYNDGYNRIFGDKHPGAFGRPARESWPEIQAFLEPALQQVRQTGEPLTFHDTLLALAKQGEPEECWFDFSYSVVPGADGTVLGLMSIAAEKTRDVVLARRQATCDIPADVMAGGKLEDLATALEQRLRANKMDAAAAVMLALDPGNHAPARTLFQIGDWNELKDWAGTHRALHGQVDQLCGPDTGRPADVGNLVALVTLLDDYHQPIAILALAPHVLVPAAGHLDFATSLCRRLQGASRHADTLDAYRSRIAEQDDLYRFLFDNIVDAAVYARTDGGAQESETILAANPGACRLFGYELEELVGMTREQLRHPDDTSLQPAMEHREREGAFIGELMLRRKDGSAVTVDITSRLVASRDGTMHSVNILRDVSVRAREDAERARLARFEAIAQLTAGMAHDFNNLLTVVQGSLELVIDDLPESARAREYAANALLSAERGAALTNQLLTYTRRQLLHLQAENLNASVLELLPLVKATVGERIDLQLALEPDLPACHTDLAQLTTAMLNLAANARDAMPAGGSLKIETGRDPERPNSLVLRVTDSGPGIPGDLLDRVFEPYFSTKTKGSGLGLAMVQGFVHQSGGHVRVRNIPQGGACFELQLPVANPSLAPVPLVSDATLPAPRSRGGHVLLVDDNPLIRMQTREILLRAGFQVREAADAEQALARLRDNVPDLLLTDVDMPGERNGLALATEARARYDALAILVMTGHDPLAIAEAAQGDRIATLPKPFDRATLLQAVAAQLPASS